MALYANEEKLLSHLSDWKSGWENEEDSDRKAWTLTAIDYFINLLKISSTTEIPSYSEIQEDVIEALKVKLCEALSEQSGALNIDGRHYDILTLDKAIDVLMDIAAQIKKEV